MAFELLNKNTKSVSSIKSNGKSFISFLTQTENDDEITIDITVILTIIFSGWSDSTTVNTRL